MKSSVEQQFACEHCHTMMDEKHVTVIAQPIYDTKGRVTGDGWLRQWKCPNCNHPSHEFLHQS